MSYDLNVLVLNQKYASILPFKSSIDIVNEYQEALRYKEIWEYMTRMNGIWYSLGKDDDGWFNTLSIVDADFEAPLENRIIPYWIADEDTKSNLTPLNVLSEYKNDFERLLKFFIQESPVNTIMFLARYQGGEKEIVCGVIKYAEFLKLLAECKILFNICYIISE